MACHSALFYHVIVICCRFFVGMSVRKYTLFFNYAFAATFYSSLLFIFYILCSCGIAIFVLVFYFSYSYIFVLIVIIPGMLLISHKFCMCYTIYMTKNDVRGHISIKNDISIVCTWLIPNYCTVL
jgi:hypothetical protein